MDKPKELTGKVKKFEEIASNYSEEYSKAYKGYMEVNSVSHQNSNRLLFVWRLANFYNQPFKPEMIEEYFINVERMGISIFATKSRKVFEVYKLDDMLVINNLIGLEIPVPTLSDFIDACANSSINLEWK